MAATNNLEVLRGEDRPDEGRRLTLAIEALRARIAEEFQISERLDTKGRQVFALAAGFFVVAQAVAFSAFRANQMTGGERFAVAVVAALAVLSLVLAGHRLANAEEPSPEEDIKPSAIEQWAKEKSDRDFARQLVVHLRSVADARHASNEARVKRYGAIETRARLALIFTGVELLLAIASRM